MSDAGTNGNGHAEIVPPSNEQMAALAELRSLEESIFLARAQFMRQAGITYEGQRDEYVVLGYGRQITTKEYRDEYARGGIAGRIVDTPPNATWRGSMELREEKEVAKKYTAFEQAWLDLEQRLQITAKFRRVDILAGLSTYAVLLIGAPGNLEEELPKGNPKQLLYLMPFSGGGGPASTRGSQSATASDADASIFEYEVDPASPRFGLPKSYQLRRTDVTSPVLQRPVHWTRILHVAEGLLDDEVFGQPALERVWNYLIDLRKVAGGGSESFWLRANQGLHLDVDKDMALSAQQDAVASLKEQAEAYKHQLTRWLRTRGVKVETLGSDVANFSNPVDALLTLIAGAKAIPKRILTGSEMGELASSQDRDNWKDQVNGRQTQYAGPYIVRPLVDRLIAYGYLPEPRGGPLAYNVVWPHIQTMTEQEKVTGAQGWASVNSTMGQTVFTEEEIREKWADKEALTPEQKQQAIDDKAAAAPPPPPMPEAPAEEEVPALKAAEDMELLRVLEAAIRADNQDVVLQIIGLRE